MAEFLTGAGWSPAQLTIGPQAIPNHRATRPAGGTTPNI
jgi:hypothetical protein